MQFFLLNVKNWIYRQFRCERALLENKSNLMERLSYELRTSLTGIVGYSEYLESIPAEPMVNFTAKIIRESSLCLARASNSFFDLHRLESGQISADSSSFSGSELIRDVVRTHQRYALDQAVTLEFTCSAETFFVEINSDQKRMNQMADSLIFSTVQLAEKGSAIHVEVSVDKDKNYMKLMLTTSGPILDVAQVELFRKFWNADDYKFSLQAGPSVELALSKALIYFLQGDVEYQVRPEARPRLIVRLPIRYKQR